MSNLDAIRSRLEALMRHAGGTDYAGQVIADNIALVAEVEQLRAGAVVILNNAWEDGAREERQNVVACLRRFEAGPMGLSLVDMASVANAIERGEHVKGRDE